MKDILENFSDKKGAEIIMELPKMFGGIEVITEIKKCFQDTTAAL